MKQLSLILFLFLLFISCSQENPEKYTGNVEEIFSEISVSEELNLYVDRTGQPADGRYTSNYQNGSVQADITFRDGMIAEGKVFSSDGVLTIRYTTENDLMKTSYYTKSSQPRMVTLHGDDLSDQIALHTWDLDFIVKINRRGFEGAFDQFIDFKQGLEQIYDRPVDLYYLKKFRNSIFQQEVERSKQLLYAA